MCVVIYLFILHYRPRVGIVHPWRVCVSQLLRPPSKHCSDQQGQISYSGSLDLFWVGGEKPSRRSSSKRGSAIRLEIPSAPISLKHLWAAIVLSPTLPPASLLKEIIKVIYMNWAWTKRNGPAADRHNQLLCVLMQRRVCVYFSACWAASSILNTKTQKCSSQTLGKESTKLTLSSKHSILNIYRKLWTQTDFPYTVNAFSPPPQFMDSVGNNAAKAIYEQLVPAFYYCPTFKDCT